MADFLDAYGETTVILWPPRSIQRALRWLLGPRRSKA